MLYSEFKKILSTDGKNTTLLNLLAGGATGIASTFMNNPIDVVKSKM